VRSAEAELAQPLPVAAPAIAGKAAP